MEDYIVLKVEDGIVDMSPSEIDEAIASGTFVVLCYDDGAHYYPYMFTSNHDYMFIRLNDPLEYKLFVRTDKSVDDGGEL